jgi:hypothetical protein
MYRKTCGALCKGASDGQSDSPQGRGVTEGFGIPSFRTTSRRSRGRFPSDHFPAVAWVRLGSER